MHLQHELLETNTKMTELDGECCNGTLLKAKNDRVVALADELKMVKKISGAKDLELDQMQLRVKAFESESMHVCMH